MPPRIQLHMVLSTALRLLTTPLGYLGVKLGETLLGYLVVDSGISKFNKIERIFITVQ